jgi:hypothetical protein
LELGEKDTIMTQPSTLVTVELTQVEAALVAEYLRAANGPIGHTARLAVIAKTLEFHREAAAEKDHAVHAAEVAERDRLYALGNEATEAGKSAGYNHASYVDAYGGEVASETAAYRRLPERYTEVDTRYVAGFLEGAQDYEDEQYADEN